MYSFVQPNASTAHGYQWPELSHVESYLLCPLAADQHHCLHPKQVATNTESARNAGNAILYECVQVRLGFLLSVLCHIC